MSSPVRYIIKKRDGTVLDGLQLGVDVRKTLDKRSDRGQPQVVYEVRQPSGVWVRIWSDEILDVVGEVV